MNKPPSQVNTGAPSVCGYRSTVSLSTAERGTSLGDRCEHDRTRASAISHWGSAVRPPKGLEGRRGWLRTITLSAVAVASLAGCALPKMTSDSTASAEASRVENIVVIEDSPLAAMTTGALRARGLPARGRPAAGAGQPQPAALPGRTAVIHVAASYDLDGWPASAVANVTTAPDGEQIAVVRVQNGWLLQQGSALDRLVRRDVQQTASELSAGIAQRIRIANR